MKILMVTMSMSFGGAETHVLELIRELQKRGHNVTLASAGGVYADVLKSIGVNCVTLPLESKNPSAVIKSYRGLEKLIREEHFDIVHSHARIPSFIVGLLHEKIREKNGQKFRFVTSAHLNFAVNPLWRLLSRWGERVIAVSDDIADYLVKEYGYPREHISTTINGIDTAKFSPDTDFTPVLEKFALEKSRRRIVYMSRLDSDRAEPAFRLLDIAPRLSQKYPDADIIIVGDGDQFAELSEIAGNINKFDGKKLVTMTGGVANTNEFCAAADVFIGVSRSALEAMSSGKAVIIAGGQGALGIFDETKIESAIETNFCCRGLEPESNERLFSDISELLDNPEKRQKSGEFNRDFILKYYTADRMADDYLALYTELLASPVKYSGKNDVMISGYYGFGNLGDESLLEIISQSAAREIDGIKIAALTRKPRRDSLRTGLKCISRINIPKMIREMSRTDVLISGGGSLLQDKTSKRSLLYYLGVINLAKFIGKKVYIYANGIGPIIHQSHKKKVAKALAKADVISVRDSGSKNELISLGADEKKIRVSADPAFLIANKTEKTEKIGRKESFFVISIRLMDFSNGDYTALTPRDEEILAENVTSCAQIAKKYGYLPIIIPMQESHDIHISQKLAENLSEIGVKSEIIIPKTAAELVNLLSDARLVIGMRLHTVIFASAAAVPVIGLSYDPKVESFMNELGQKYSIDLTEDDFSEKLIGFADEIIEKREQIAAELQQKSEELRRRAEQDVKILKSLL